MPSSKLEDTLNLYLVTKAPSLPKGVKWFIVKIAPYYVILEIIFLVGAILTVFDAFYPIIQWIESNLPTNSYDSPFVAFGFLIFVFQIWFGITTCQLFTSYLDCSFVSYSNLYPSVTPEYTNFIIYLVKIILPLVLVMKLFALPKLFARKKSGWNSVFFASLLISVLFLMSLNIKGFIFTLLSFYFLFQIRKYYK
jgi:hypothetical protein